MGAIKNFVELNNDDNNDCIFCVVDLHAITVNQEPSELKNNIRETVATFIANVLILKSIILTNHKSVLTPRLLGYLVVLLEWVG